VLDSNERRLEALDRQGVQVTVDGPTALEFLLDRALVNGTARELRLNWMLNVAGLLNHIETAAHKNTLARIDLSAPEGAAPTPACGFERAGVRTYSF